VKPSLIARVVAASCRFALIVVPLGLLLAVGAAMFTAKHFAMTADTAELISPKLKWRQDDAALDRAFPQNASLTAVVIDGATPELAEAAADKLTDALSQHHDLFQSVRRPNGGPFFQKEGLLLLPVNEVQSTINQLLQAQAFLGPLAADPSVRGVMGALDTALVGVQHGQAKLSDLDKPMKGLADSLEKTADGKPAYFSWQALFSSGPHAAGTRQFILVKPVLDYGSIEPVRRTVTPWAVSSFRSLAIWWMASLDLAPGSIEP
jgi:hypothetical protein